ncbi:MAG: hypothetical protein ACK4Q5_15220 [Saprospiraceae bacterium]
MQNTKLLAAVRTLTPRERQRWREFVFSDFVCKHLKTRELCELVLAAAPGFDSPELDKRTAFARIFGASEAYNELKINNLISDLLALLHDFLAYEKFATRPALQKPALLDALLERDLAAHAPDVLARFRQLLDREPHRAADWSRDEAVFYEKAEQLTAHTARRDHDENLQKLGDALDRAFVLEKLRVGCAMLSRNSVAVISATYQPQHLADVRRWCGESATLADEPAVQVYLACLDLLERQQDADFQVFKSKLGEHTALFPQADLLALYTYALNFCIRKINAGAVAWYHETLDLYQTLLARGILLQNGHLSQWSYKNIVTAGLRSRAFGWTEDFIRTWRDRLPPDERENAFAYNLAALFLEKGEHRRALFALQNVEFTHHSYHLGAKIMQLKSYFALDEGDALHSLADATDKYIRRNRQFSGYGKAANLNFLKLLRRAFQVKNELPLLRDPKKIARLDKLRRAIGQANPLANKDWLAAMVDNF